MADFVVRTTTRKRIEYVLPAETNWGQIGKVIAVIAQDRTARGYSTGWDDAVTVTVQAGRDVVTPEQVVEAAKAIEAVEAQSTHTTFAMARAALYSVGLFVAEGETT